MLLCCCEFFLSSILNRFYFAKKKDKIFFSLFSLRSETKIHNKVSDLFFISIINQSKFIFHLSLFFNEVVIMMEALDSNFERR
jgi:hypothetical protein